MSKSSEMPLLSRIAMQVSQNAKYQFWALQTGFWLFIGIVSLFTLTLWYGQINLLHIAHTFLQSALGLLFSLPLFWLLMKIWHMPLMIRAIASIGLALVVSLVWTLARLAAYIQMTGFEKLWGDLGGWYFGSIFIYLCWTGLFHGIRYYQLLQHEHRIMLKAESEARGEQLKRLQAQAVARDAKIKMLRYQLNPHFLCNTLNAVNSLIEAKESEKAQKMTVQLSKFLRYSLDNNPDTKITLAHEINALNLYLEIEKTRFGERLKLDFSADEQAQSAYIPSLLLQPIIENSMKHVIAQNENGGTISLNAYVKEYWLVIELSDTGSGASFEQGKIKRSNGRGIGLRNIDERLKVLYRDNYIFDLNIMPSGGLKTTIKIPFEPIIISNNRNNSIG